MPEALVSFDFPELVVSDFTHGDCWQLAAALYQVTFYPYIYIRDEYEIQHVGIELPDGNIVDIEGIWDPSDWQTRWYDELDDCDDVFIADEATHEEVEEILYKYDSAIENYVYSGLTLKEIRQSIVAILEKVNAMPYDCRD